MNNKEFIKAVIFDLDNTLFDHFHSMRTAIRNALLCCSEIRVGDPSIDVVKAYSNALEEAYKRYEVNEITYDEKDALKIELFFKNIGVEYPDEKILKKFVLAYNITYMQSRRATPGSVETLVRLSENNYSIYIVTNGPKKEQYEKAEFIGVADLVDDIFTSESLGVSKPQFDFFDAVLKSICLDGRENLLIGDSIENDIKGALNIGIIPILYDPIGSNSSIIVAGSEVRAITKIDSVLEILEIKESTFSVDVEVRESEIVVDGIGIDIVTAERHCLNISAESVHEIVEGVSLMVQSIIGGDSMDAIRNISKSFFVTAKAAKIN